MKPKYDYTSSYFLSSIDTLARNHLNNAGIAMGLGIGYTTFKRLAMTSEDIAHTLAFARYETDGRFTVLDLPTPELFRRILRQATSRYDGNRLDLTRTLLKRWFNRDPNLRRIWNNSSYKKKRSYYEKRTQTQI